VTGDVSRVGVMGSDCTIRDVGAISFTRITYYLAHYLHANLSNPTNMPDSPPPPYTAANTSDDSPPPVYTANDSTNINLALTPSETQELRAYLANLSLDYLEDLIHNERRASSKEIDWELLYIYMKEVQARKKGGAGWDGEIPGTKEIIGEIRGMIREEW